MEINKKMLTFGTDPEVFAVQYNNKKPFVISPALLEKFSDLEPIKDARKRPERIKHPFYIKNDEFTWMMDGVAFEVTFNDPFTDSVKMNKVINTSLTEIEKLLKTLSYKDKELQLYTRPVVNINPEEYIEYLGDESIFQGFIFGCDKDFDAINPEYNCEILDVENHLYRYGGGHFHVGSTNVEEKELMQDNILHLIQLFAIHIGNWCIFKSPYPFEEKLRAFHYGNPGRFRPQEWGVEYRTPSNSWMSDLDTLEGMMEGARKSIQLLKNPSDGKKVIDKFLKRTIECIESADQEIAESIIMEVL